MNRSERRHSQHSRDSNSRFEGRGGEGVCDRCLRLPTANSPPLLASPPLKGWFCYHCHAALNPLELGKSQMFAPDTMQQKKVEA